MEACRGAEIPEIDECHPDDHNHGSGDGEGSGAVSLGGGFMEVTNDAYRSGSGSGDASANLDFMNDADGGVDGSGSGDATANLDFMNDASGSPLYTMSDQGTNICPDGYLGIEDRATCEAEAAEIKNVLRDTQVRAPEHTPLSSQYFPLNEVMMGINTLPGPNCST